MISRYNGKCWICGDATKAGTDFYDIEHKRSYHQRCHDDVVHVDEPATDGDVLANKLGFKPQEPAC